MNKKGIFTMSIHMQVNSNWKETTNQREQKNTF